MDLVSEKYLKRLMIFLKDEFAKSLVIAKLEDIIKNHRSTAGIREEDVFNRDFLCPAIAKYFYHTVKGELKLSDDEIKKGLGTEGFYHLPGFGFTPSRKKPHLFVKNDFLKPR